MNVSDSERIASQLEADGYEMTDSEDSADVILFNTCSVREKAEHKLFTRVGQVHHSPNKDKIVGIMGCVAQLEGDTLFKKTDGVNFVLGTQAVGRVSDAIKNVSKKKDTFVDLDGREVDYDWSTSSSQRHSPYIAFVPIIEGCNKFCTYCIVPFARGREKSLSASEIIREVLRLRREGVKEVHLIGQNVNSYRPETESGLEEFDGSTLFSRLLRAVAATGIERLKFTTSFPRDFHSDIVDAMDEYENLCDWVHLPVQSGSNRILKAMRRGHTIENYKKRIDKIKSSPRDISLTTDIIVGFPGETDEDFAKTIDLVENCRFDSSYIFKYSPRLGTPAAELEDDVDAETKKQRFLELEKVQKRIQAEIFNNCLGTTKKVLAEKVSGRVGEHLTGHSTCQKVVNFKAGKDFLGKVVDVRITECKTNTLHGEIC